MAAATGRSLQEVADAPGEALLWERFFERRPPVDIWLERIALLLARIGMTVETVGTTSDHKVDAQQWFFWEELAEKPAQEDDDYIAAAWGDAYDMLVAESEGG